MANKGKWPGIPVVQLKSVLRAPITQALALQFGAFLVLLGFSYLADALIGFQISIALAVLLQGVLAAAFSYWRGLASWWLLIQLLLPVALATMQFLQLPPVFFLLAFVFLLALYWTTFRTQVPFYPSGPNTWDGVASMLPQDRGIRFIDIGSGFGGLVMDLAARRSDSAFTGIEVAPLPWFASLLRSHARGSRGRFIRGDYDELNFAQYDVVFAYLSPAAMPALWDKARREMRPGSLLLSYEFPIPDVRSHITSPTDARGANIYGWHM